MSSILISAKNRIHHRLNARQEKKWQPRARMPLLACLIDVQFLRGTCLIANVSEQMLVKKTETHAGSRREEEKNYAIKQVVVVKSLLRVISKEIISICSFSDY